MFWVHHTSWAFLGFCFFFFFLSFCQLHKASMLKDMDKVGASLVFLGTGYVKIASRFVFAPWRRELRHTATFTDALWRQDQPKAHGA